MLNKFLGKSAKKDFVVIDSTFPQKDPYAFRNVEISEYFRRINNFASYTMLPMKPGKDAWFAHGYGVTHEEFIHNKQGYLKFYPQNADKIFYLKPSKRYNFKLAYSYFLAETYVLLPFFEEHKIPFVFVLYPGGSFGLNNDKSDQMLRHIFQSKYFRKVIVTQKITKDYLISNKLCSPEEVAFIYGGFVQFKKSDVKPKKYYKKDKATFDICFVAAKYASKGADKGYDLFIEAAKILCKQTDDIIFHVVGGFDENEIDVSDIKSRIRFYGYKRPDFLLDFYSTMEIFLGPGRPFKLYEGNFDGFPLGIDAAYCGVALFTSDELKMNHNYTNKKDIVITTLDAKKIANQILAYYNNYAELYKLSAEGQAITQELFDIDKQIDERIKIFGQFVDLNLI